MLLFFVLVVTFQQHERFVFLGVTEQRWVAQNVYFVSLLKDLMINLIHFRLSQWTQGTNEAMKYSSCVTKSERSEIERRSGVRYSYLLELPYFNAPRMCVVDPMHNLLLGASKMMVELWKSSGIVTTKDFELMP